MVASTARACGTTTPSAAAASVTLCPTVKPVTSTATSRMPPGDHDQQEEKREMIPAAQDVLDAQAEVATEPPGAPRTPFDAIAAVGAVGERTTSIGSGPRIVERWT